MQNQLTLANRLAQKGTGIRLRSHCIRNTTREIPGVKHHPTVTTNGHSERDNPQWLS
jgi:hypothetical protein